MKGFAFAAILILLLGTIGCIENDDDDDILEFPDLSKNGLVLSIDTRGNYLFELIDVDKPVALSKVSYEVRELDGEIVYSDPYGDGLKMKGKLSEIRALPYPQSILFYESAFDDYPLGEDLNPYQYRMARIVFVDNDADDLLSTGDHVIVDRDPDWIHTQIGFTLKLTGPKVKNLEQYVPYLEFGEGDISIVDGNYEIELGWFPNVPITDVKFQLVDRNRSQISMKTGVAVYHELDTISAISRSFFVDSTRGSPSIKIVPMVGNLTFYESENDTCPLNETDPDKQYFYVAFQDHDRNDLVSPGDKLIVKGRGNGGLAGPGDIIRLISDRTRNILIEKVLPQKVPTPEGRLRSHSSRTPHYTPSAYNVIIQGFEKTDPSLLWWELIDENGDVLRIDNLTLAGNVSEIMVQLGDGEDRFYENSTNKNPLNETNQEALYYHVVFIDKEMNGYVNGGDSWPRGDFFVIKSVASGGFALHTYWIRLIYIPSNSIIDEASINAPR